LRWIRTALEAVCLLQALLRMQLLEQVQALEQVLEQAQERLLQLALEPQEQLMHRLSSTL
jgi:hypothetical protein